ncbi:MAG: helicase associated domain-containing protein [Bacteroidales bacterium]|nr:helicase associated domain-containing protein [Bacteroidales bacterium]
MTQDELWLNKYQEVVAFIERNKRNPSRYDDEERGKYCNWLRHNRKLLKAGEMKEERMEKFRELVELMERYRRVNQYE